MIWRQLNLEAQNIFTTQILSRQINTVESNLNVQVSCTQVTLESENCNLETKNNLETAKFRGLEYFHNPNTYQIDKHSRK